MRYLLALLAALVIAPSASADAFIVRSTPAAGETVTSVPHEVVLEFDRPVPGLRADVTRPGGGSVRSGEARASGRRVVIPLQRDVANGGYVVEWSAGRFPFTVAAARSSGDSPFRWALLGAGVVLAAAAVRVRRLRVPAALVVVAGAATVIWVGGGGPARPALPVPARDAFVTAGAAGPYAVGVALRNEPGGVRARATVLGQQGPASGRRVTIEVSGRALQGAPCGDGCYDVLARGRRLTSLGVDVGRAHADLRVPERWPAPRADAIVRRAHRVFGNLRSVTFLSILGPTTTLWKAQAPNRLSAVEQHTGEAAVVIGGRRWDRDSADARWQPSPQSPIRQPTPPWPAAFTDAHLLGSAQVNGQAVWRVSFLDPQTPAWFTIDVDKASGRTYRMDMIAQAHFMREDYSRFNAPTAIVPPR
jgi:methionine-rich copper-binding protein CopC